MIPAMLLLAVSDHPGDRWPGAVLLVLTAAALIVAAWLLAELRARARPVSLLTSALWLVGAALVYPTQEFAADAAWASGVPALAAVITAALALSLPTHRSSASTQAQS